MAKLNMDVPTASPLPYFQDFETGNWNQTVTINRQNNNGRIKVRSGTDGNDPLNLLVLDLSYNTEILTRCEYIERIEIEELVEHQLTYDAIILEDGLDANSGVFISYDNGASFIQLQKLDTMEYQIWFRDTILFTPQQTGTALLKIEYTGRKEFPNGGMVFDNMGIKAEEVVIPTEANEQTLAKINIFPNPASDRIEITGLGSMNVNTIRMTDLQGKLVAEWTVQEQLSEMLTLPDNINNGLYYLGFLNETGHVGSKPVVVNR